MALKNEMVRAIDARVRLPKEFRPAIIPPHDGYQSRYEEVLGTATTGDKCFTNLLTDMADANVEGVILHAEYEYGEVAEALNQSVATLVDEHAEVIAGVGTVSMLDATVMQRVSQVRSVAEMGLVGVNIQPSFFGMPIDDRELYPMYAKATELGLVVYVHTGVNYTVHRPIKNDHPLQLDQVACDFPELRLVACHAGWPFVLDMVAVARKHPLVYMDFGGLAPKYVGQSGTGWDPLFGLMNSLLQSQILFATDWPVFSMSRAISEWCELGLSGETLNKLLRQNALDLLGEIKA